MPLTSDVLVFLHASDVLISPCVFHVAGLSLKKKAKSSPNFTSISTSTPTLLTLPLSSLTALRLLPASHVYEPQSPHVPGRRCLITAIAPSALHMQPRRATIGGSNSSAATPGHNACHPPVHAAPLLTACSWHAAQATSRLHNSHGCIWGTGGLEIGLPDVLLACGGSWRWSGGVDGVDVVWRCRWSLGGHGKVAWGYKKERSCFRGLGLFLEVLQLLSLVLRVGLLCSSVLIHSL
jgi:hypothetical protein